MAAVSGNTKATRQVQAEAQPFPSEPPEALTHLSDAIACGTSWPTALLEAVGLWTLPEEVYRGRLHRYLIRGEAFDWLLLAQRLAHGADGLIPTQERRQLLRQGSLPTELSLGEFQRLVGRAKYHAYLNYWYGVTVETALQEAVREEVRKERMSRGLSPHSRVTAETFRRIYGEARRPLLAQYLRERERPPCPLAPGGLLKELTYWLFTRRLQRSDGTRVASDTRKGLEWLHQHHQEGLSWQVSLAGLSLQADESA